HSTIRRLSAARAHRADLDWWKQQLAQCSKSTSSSLRVLLLVSHFRDAHVNVISDCEPVSSTILEKISKDEWVTLASLVDSLVIETRQAWLVPTSASLRFLYLCSARCSRLEACRVFQESFLSIEDDTVKEFQRYRQTWAIQSVLTGGLDWHVAS